LNWQELRAKRDCRAVVSVVSIGIYEAASIGWNALVAEHLSAQAELLNSIQLKDSRRYSGRALGK